MSKPNHDTLITFDRATAKVAFRLEDRIDESGVNIIILRYYVIRETADGAWVVDASRPRQLKCLGGWVTWKDARKQKLIRWISRNAARSYCNLSYDAALLSYQRRKECQVFHAKAAMQTAELALANLDTIAANAIATRTISIGKIPMQDAGEITFDD
jgi:hypothetical protein